MLIELIKGIAFLLALSLIQNYIIRGLQKYGAIRQVASGVLFGSICVIGMMVPIQFSPGVIFDARSVILAMAGFFGGPIVGCVAGIIAGGYRLWMGGLGAGVGTGVIVTCVALGLGYRYCYQKGWVKIGVIQYLVFGFIVHISAVAWFMLFPPEIVAKVMNDVAIPFVAVFTLATAILGVLLQDIEKRREIVAALKKSEGRFRALFENSPVCIHELDFDGRLISMNKSGLAMLEQTSEAMVRGTDYISYVNDAEKPWVRKLLDQAVNGEGCAFEFSSNSDVDPLIFSSCFIPLKNADGAVERIMGITEDITRRKRAEEELRKSHDEQEARVEDRTRALLEKTELLQATLTNMRGGIVVFDAQGRMLAWNAQFFKIFQMPDHLQHVGLEYEEIARFDAEHGLFDRDLDMESLVQERLEGFAEGRAETEEISLTDGRIIKIRRNPMLGGGQVCTYHDITIRKHAAEQVKEKEAQLRAVLDNISGGIRYVDANRNYVFFNSQYCKLYDFPDGLLKIGDSVRIENLFQAKRGDFGAGDVDSLTDTWLEKLPVLEEPQSWERTTIHGKTLQVDTTPTPNGGIINIVTDITERKQAEVKLQEALAWLEKAQRIGQVGHFVWDEIEDREIHISKETNHIWGFEDDFLLPTWSEFLTSVHPGDRDRVSCLQKESVKAGTGYECEYRIVIPNGETRIIMERGEPVFDDDEMVIKTVGTVQNITERKRIEKVLRGALEEAECANRSKSDFMTTMSHELRTPLNAIIGFSSMIRDQLLGPKKNDVYAEYGADIYNSGHHLLRLINDLLDLSKIEAGKLELNIESLDVEKAILEATHTIEPVAARSNVEIRTEWNEILPPLMADRRALDQILLNLLSNAIKFTPRGGQVTVRGFKKGKNTHLAIMDNGIGIEPADIDKVLQPWGQVTDPMTSDTKGSGLGLPIVKSLVELHGGKLSLESKVGEGTVVTVVLPTEGPMN